MEQDERRSGTGVGDGEGAALDWHLDGSALDRHDGRLRPWYGRAPLAFPRDRWDVVSAGMRPMLAIIVVLVLSACGAAGAGGAAVPASVPLGSDFVLTPGQSTRVDVLSVKFDRVAGDSRCPPNAECFWEGDATVLVTLRSPSAAGAGAELHTSQRFARSTRFDGYTVELVGLDRDYRATLRVSR